MAGLLYIVNHPFEAGRVYKLMPAFGYVLNIIYADRNDWRALQESETCKTNNTSNERKHHVSAPVPLKKKGGGGQVICLAWFSGNVLGTWGLCEFQCVRGRTTGAFILYCVA